MQDGAIKHNSALWNFFPTGEADLNMFEGFGQNFPLLSPQTRLDCYHIGIGNDEDQHLCDDCFVLYPTLEKKLAPATG